MLRFSPSPVLAVFSALALVACGDKDDDTGGESASFARVYDEVLQPSCAYSTCHEGSGSAGLGWTDESSAHAALVDVDATQISGMVRVSPGDPDDSYLMWKLEGAEGIGGDRMPPDASLDEERLALVRDWITQGAPAE